MKFSFQSQNHNIIYNNIENWAQVTLIVSFLSVMNSVLSLIIPGLWFTGYEIEHDKFNDFKEGKDLIESLLVFYAIVISTLGILIIVFFKEKPLTPPSFTATVKRYLKCT